MTVYTVWRYWEESENDELVEIFSSLSAAEKYVKRKKEQYHLEHTIKEFKVRN
jgi:hypothetical protein